MEKQEKIEILKKLQGELEQLEEMHKSARELETSLEKTQQALSLYESRIAEETAQMIEKRRTALQSSLSKEVKNASRRLESAKKRRMQAKDKQVKIRIAGETSGHYDQIKTLKKEIKEILKANKMPGKYGRRSWYRLYMPSGIFDYCLLALCVILFGFIAPVVLYQFLPAKVHYTWMLCILIPLFLILCIYPYLHLLQKAREKYPDQITRIKEKFLQIENLDQEITDTTKNITESPDDSVYDLGRQDEVLNAAKERLDNARAEQEKQLLEFEQVVKEEIKKGFDEQSAPKKAELQATIDRLGKERTLTLEMAGELQLRLVDEYEETVGAENLNLSKVKSLLRKLEAE